MSAPNFDPLGDAPFTPRPRRGVPALQRASRTAPYVYYDNDVVLGVNVALATQRPLLLSGPSGCGKSSLARSVAQWFGWPLYEHVVTARTEARDLLYRFDAVRRLSDAQAGGALPPAAYVEPGALWWAMSPSTAVMRGSKEPLDLELRANDRSGAESGRDAVLLIDEIDKADPDLPNGLLVPLGEYRIPLLLSERDEIPAERVPLVIVTNNGERELPATFVRRCISLRLRSPDKAELVKIARARFPRKQWNAPLFERLAERLIQLGVDQDVTLGQRWSTGEYLDAVQACIDLGIAPDAQGGRFEKLLEIALEKPQPSAALG